jgi:hypothetical protein
MVVSPDESPDAHGLDERVLEAKRGVPALSNRTLQTGFASNGPHQAAGRELHRGAFFVNVAANPAWYHEWDGSAAGAVAYPTMLAKSFTQRIVGNFGREFTITLVSVCGPFPSCHCRTSVVPTGALFRYLMKGAVYGFVSAGQLPYFKKYMKISGEMCGPVRPHRPAKSAQSTHILNTDPRPNPRPPVPSRPRPVPVPPVPPSRPAADAGGTQVSTIWHDSFDSMVVQAAHRRMQ